MILMFESKGNKTDINIRGSGGSGSVLADHFYFLITTRTACFASNPLAISNQKISIPTRNKNPVKTFAEYYN